MSFEDYIKHYTAMPDILWFVLISALVLTVARLLLKIGKKTKEELRCEKYYELMISSTSILLFTGIYFLIDYRYFSFNRDIYVLWDEHSDLLLLAALVLAIVITDVIDHLFIPMHRLKGELKSPLRIAAMIYMLAVFGYIKYVYLDNNYDSIIMYFILMIIGRFVYFDASFKDFLKAMKELFFNLPILLLALATTALLALYGFSSGYLLRKNGVVLSLWIGHLYIIIEMILLSAVERFIRLVRKKSKKKTKKKNVSDTDSDESEYIEDDPAEESVREAAMLEEDCFEEGYIEESYIEEDPDHEDFFENDLDKDEAVFPKDAKGRHRRRKSL